MCSNDYYLNKREDKCIRQSDDFLYCRQTVDGKSCEKCDEGYYFNEEGKCISVNFCDKETKFIGCQKCKNGYFLTENGDSCTKEINCYLGNKDLGICKQCKSGYYLDYMDGKCKSNEENNDFKYCTMVYNNECRNCVYGTHLGEDYKCSLSKNCQESDQGICIQCKDNYHLGLDNKCSNIEKCIYTDDSNFDDICLECENNFFYNKTSRLCEVMYENFENCKTTNYYGNTCLNCKNNFYLNKTDNLCYSNMEKDNFYKCAYTNIDGNYCGWCEDGYYYGYIDHKCSKIEGCDISENENRCLKCDTDHNFCLDLKTGKCEYNDEIENEDKKIYYKCNITNKDSTSCEICINGYSLNKKGLCNDDLHCEEKDEEGFCKKCKNFEDEYSNHCLNNEFGCVETYLDGCEICNNILDFDNCTKCFEGYELNEDNECIEIKK